MKTKLQPKILLLVCTLLFFVFQTKSFAGPSNFTWIGTTSTSWTTATNWTPNGVPSTSDTVTIVSGSRDVSLSGNITVKKFTITSGTVYLNDFTLTITTHATFTSGTITAGAGRLVVSSATSTTFSGTTFSVPATITSNAVYLNGSTFNDSLTITKNGNSNDNSKGGNLYKKQFLLTNSAKGAFVLSDSFPDTYEKKLIIKNTNEGTVYLAHRASGTIFKDDVTFYGKNIYSNYYGTAEYQGNIILNCPAGNVYFGYGSGSSTLANTKRLQLGDSAFAAGKLTLMHFTKLGTDGEINLTLTGSAILTFESGTVINSTIAISSPTLYLHGARFNNLADLTVTGTSTASSEGGCYFAADAKITNNSSGSNSFAIGNTVADTFATTSTITNTKGTLSMNNAVFVGNTILKNVETSTNSDRFIIASTGNCIFQGNIQIQNSVSGFCFGKTSGTASLASGKTLSFVSGFTGNLTLKNFTQQGSTAQSFSFTSTGQKLFLGPGSTFNGNFDFTGHFIVLNGTTFNGTATINRYGGVPDTCAGGNIFNSTTIIKDSTNAAYSYLMAYTNADDYNGDVIFIQKGSGAILYPAYNKNSTFAGNITVNSNSAFQFGGNGGKVILDGTTNQNLSNLSSYPVTMKKLQLNKTANSFTLNFPLTVSDSLILTQGRINTDTINLLSISNGGKLSGGSDNSYINGPMKKTGNSTFVFPLGSSSLTHPYHPIEITTPSSTTDAYTANYFSTSQTIGSAIDTSIDNLNACQYWKLNRNTGTSKVKVKLSWNNDSCETISPSNFRVTGWNGSMWKDLGNASPAGDSIQGTVQSLDSLNTINVLTLAFKKCSAFRKTISHYDVRCKGGSDGLISVSAMGATAGYNYLWSGGMGVSAVVKNLRAGKYDFLAMDSRGCMLSDSVVVTEPDSILIESTLIKPNCSDSTGVIILSISGGHGLKTNTWVQFDIESDTLREIPDGDYSYTIIDSNQCRINGIVTMDNENGPNANILTQASPLCYNDVSGKIQIEGANGTPPYNYRWLNFHNDTSKIINNVRAGIYIVEITDSLSCIGLDTIELMQADTFALSFSITNPPCGSSTGQIVPVIQGGRRPFTYTWFPSPSPDSILSSMSAGIQELTLTDSLGCLARGHAEVISSSGISLTSTILNNVICFPDSAGKALVTVSGGTAPYNYIWWPNGGCNDTASNLPPDHYAITVVDSNGCRQSTILEIKGPKLLESILSTSLPSTDSTSDGSVFATCLGGTPPYQYLWSTGGTSDSISNVGLGQYSMAVTDSRGCKSKATMEINQVRSCHTCFPFTPQCTLTHPIVCGTCLTPVYLNIEDFGANGSDDQSDQCAFEEVSNYINSLHPDVVKELTIPGGTYYVGRQVSGYNGFYLSGMNVLCFQNINNLSINRIHKNEKAILKFSDCMKYGAFDVPSNPDNRFLGDKGRLITCTLTVGNILISYSGTTIDPAYNYNVWDPDPTHLSNPFVPPGAVISNITSNTFTISSPPSNFTGTIIYQLGIISDCQIAPVAYGQLADCGDMIHLNFCKNISINNLELDGNIQNAVIGGGGYADGLQISYDGIFINASNDITIRNVDEHHFGHDGIWIRYVDCDLPSTASTADMNCHIINSKFLFNGRNAISWTGGRGLTCINSEFSFSGQSRVVSQPGAGMDIEYEPYPYSAYYSQENSNGTFNNCKFRYNKYHGFVSDGGIGTRFTSNTYNFRSCEFVSGESVDCIWPNVAGCHFLNCNFYGLLVKAFSNSVSLSSFTPDNDCVFENCYFAENYKERYPLSPVECFGIHSFSTTESETIYSGGQWVPGSNCPSAHKPQIDFSVSTRVGFIGGLTEQSFSNKVMILGTSLFNVPLGDRSTINGTIFTSAGMNYCGCETDQVLMSNVNIELGGDFFFRFITPWRFTTIPPCTPYIAPFAWATPTCGIGTPLYGNFWQGGYDYTFNPPFVLEEIAPKFSNLVIVNSAMPLYASPCLSIPAIFPSTCMSALRYRNQSNHNLNSNLKVVPTISNDKITIESSQLNDYCQIVNSLGEIIFSDILIENSREIDISILRAGFYMVKSNQGSAVKFIKY